MEKSHPEANVSIRDVFWRDVMKGVWRHGENMSCQYTGNVYSGQKRVELMGTKYAISERSADLVRYLKKLLENAGLYAIRDRMSVHELIAIKHTTFYGRWL